MVAKSDFGALKKGEKRAYAIVEMSDNVGAERAMEEPRRNGTE
jgi:hypothetical protein